MSNNYDQQANLAAMLIAEYARKQYRFRLPFKHGKVTYSYVREEDSNLKVSRKDSGVTYLSVEELWDEEKISLGQLAGLLKETDQLDFAVVSYILSKRQQEEEKLAEEIASQDFNSLTKSQLKKIKEVLEESS